MPSATTNPLKPSGFAVLRTPLLPYGDAAASRDRLRAALARPEVRDAIFVASPDLADALEHWERDPTSERAQGVEHVAARYVTRMATRCTPFGLFAGCSTIEIGERTRLELGPRSAYQRHTRLDMDYLTGLADALVRDPEVRAVTTFRANSTLYEAVGQARYVETRWDGKNRTHHLVAVTATDHLHTILEHAEYGATPATLADALAATGVASGRAADYVDRLIAAHVLVPDLAPAITGPEPIGPMVERLRADPATKEVAEQLDYVAGVLAELDAGGVGADPARYRTVVGRLEALPAPVVAGKVFQADLVKPAPEAKLGREVVEEIARAIGVLHRLARRPAGDDLARFREAFELRFESRTVPLVEALDGDLGIRFGSASAAPALLRGLTFPATDEDGPPFGSRDTALLRLLEGALRGDDRELVLSGNDLDELADPDPKPLPAALAAMVTVVASSAEAVDRGRFELLVRGVHGPSGARLLGRFCHADAQLQAWVEHHLREEEDRDPDAVFAEVVHLPEGRLGNILLRPVLRDYEIPYLGRSGAPDDRQLPITDLLVSVHDGRVVLTSRRLGRRVVPRLTSAHNFSWRSQPMYRFLASLQSEDTAGGLGWSWGPLASSPFLPRVRYRRLVLTPARWRLSRHELRRLDDVAKLREARQLPDVAVLADGDNMLRVDFDDPASLESFVRLVKRRDEAVLEELYPGPDQLCCSGPEGAFAHELVVPFVVDKEPVPRPMVPTVAPTPVRRSFPPGSEWVYAKLYCGATTTDRLLRDVVAPLRDGADQWFFIRYGDPDEHVRIRFHGQVRDAVEQAAAAALDAGLIWRVSFDTYDREVERYGGAAGVPVAEALFTLDSDAVLDLVGLLLPGERGEQARWQIAVRNVDQLLDDLGLDLPAKLRLLRRVRDAFAAEHRLDPKLGGQIGERYRKERPVLEALLDRSRDDASPVAAGLQVLRRRSERLAPIVAELRALETAGRLTAPVETLAASFVHMTLNRLFRTHHRRQELVLYTFLTRLYEGATARVSRQ